MRRLLLLLNTGTPASRAFACFTCVPTHTELEPIGLLDIEMRWSNDSKWKEINGFYHSNGNQRTNGPVNAHLRSAAYTGQ